MAIFSTLRSRRMNNQKTKAIAQIIGFRLDREWFALPILAINKVIPLGNIYGDPHNTGISLTTYEGQKVLVIDVAKHIFNRKTLPLENTQIATATNSALEDFDLDRQRYLLILDRLGSEIGSNDSARETGNLIGLPIDSPPTMYRVETTAFKPLPKAYLDRGNIKCVTDKMVDLPDLPPLFVLEPDRLIASIDRQ